MIWYGKAISWLKLTYKFKFFNVLILFLTCKFEIFDVMVDCPNVYRDYIACLNSRTLQNLHLYVANDVVYNSRTIGLPGYANMLEQNFAEIPDLQFTIQLLISENEHVACRLGFDCTPIANFLGLAVNGRKIRFTENVFYRFDDGKIKEVWSVIDKAAIEAQLKEEG
jgi:predicted ester cyclase